VYFFDHVKVCYTYFMHEFFLTTNAFTIRPFRESDANALRRNIQAEEIFINTLRIPRPYRLKDAKDHIAKNLKQYRMRQPANIGFVIEVEGEAAGAVGLTFRGPIGEIGYWLAKKHWGQGIVSTAIGALLDHFFASYHLQKITARVFEFNAASTRVLEKNGFRRVRRVAKGEKKNGLWIPVCEYEIKKPSLRVR
jgi:RimJ/RimL family protein N-acetyltransferase